MKRPLAALPLLGLLALTGCGSGSSANASGASGSDDAVAVTAAFYPLAYAVERVGGDRVSVANLTKPGAEPHDVELTPKDVAGLAKADLVVVEKGFQPAVDEAVERVDGEKALDVSTAVDLSIEASEDGHDHGGEEHAEEPSPTGGAIDPHFWLDPTRYAKAAGAIADRLSEVDPDGATAYKENADAFVAELTTLDEEFRTGLASCANRDLVTGHVAFAYLADRYDFHQSGIAGLSPDAEPNAAAMKEIVEHVREHKVTTIYAETLVGRDLADTIAKETGATVAVLDPIEGLSDASAGSNYLEVMRSNLATLKKGQGCR
ncbi:ABC transporter substrate-binding protein [Knoellia flava TL1]|uniref:Zinc ABC transporter substrate-binding protein n=2 Tax=Knoellia flava TaxID=913969 RepID=A0A8H9KQ10_9MICO|nr:metal ABC transporter substrate-binding protein [Knoellia flava]KGN35439.1 ABC transporter substrate-binding protein [Knoellia flava TL1]GGB69204.1 zinc ABC transporter substrate-binding protein [Knoellia flava]